MAGKTGGLPTRGQKQAQFHCAMGNLQKVENSIQLTLPAPGEIRQQCWKEKLLCGVVSFYPSFAGLTV